LFCGYTSCIALCLGLLSPNFCVYTAYAVDKNFSSYIKLKSPTVIAIITIYRNDTVLEIQVFGQILQQFNAKIYLQRDIRTDDYYLLGDGTVWLLSKFVRLNFGEGFCGPLRLMPLFYNMEMGSNMKNFDLNMYIGLMVPFTNTKTTYLINKLNALTSIVRWFCEVIRLQLSVIFKKRSSCDTMNVQNMQLLLQKKHYLKEHV
jgi:hypothetical protein